MGDGENGDRFNRQVKATAGYAEVKAEIQLLHYRLFGNDNDGAIPQILVMLDRLDKNPMIRFGYAVRSTGRATAAFAGFAALVIGAVVGALKIADVVGWL